MSKVSPCMKESSSGSSGEAVSGGKVSIQRNDCTIHGELTIITRSHLVRVRTKFGLCAHDINPSARITHALRRGDHSEEIRWYNWVRQYTVRLRVTTDTV